MTDFPAGKKFKRPDKILKIFPERQQQRPVRPKTPQDGASQGRAGDARHSLVSSGSSGIWQKVGNPSLALVESCCFRTQKIGKHLVGTQV